MAYASHDQPTPNSGLDSLLGNVRVVTDSTTEVSGDGLIVCNKATAMTVTLLVATGSKRTLQIANINTGVVTVEGNASETINGELNQSVYQGSCMDIKDYITGKWVIV